MWSGIYMLLIILVGIIIFLVVVISALHDELREAEKALEESEKRLEDFESTAFCALRNVEEVEKELSFIESLAKIKPKVLSCQAHIAFLSLNECLTRAIALLTPVAYRRIHF